MYYVIALVLLLWRLDRRSKAANKLKSPPVTIDLPPQTMQQVADAVKRRLDGEN